MHDCGSARIDTTGRFEFFLPKDPDRLRAVLVLPPTAVVDREHRGVGGVLAREVHEWGNVLNGHRRPVRTRLRLHLVAHVERRSVGPETEPRDRPQRIEIVTRKFSESISRRHFRFIRSADTSPYRSPLCGCATKANEQQSKGSETAVGFPGDHLAILAERAKEYRWHGWCQEGLLSCSGAWRLATRPEPRHRLRANDSEPSRELSAGRSRCLVETWVPRVRPEPLGRGSRGSSQLHDRFSTCC